MVDPYRSEHDCQEERITAVCQRTACLGCAIRCKITYCPTCRKIHTSSVGRASECENWVYGILERLQLKD